MDRLRDLNRRFYDGFARAFSDSRGSTEPGLERILRMTRPGDRVLDLGCGQGRVALLLPAGCTYVGLDFSAEMLALARDRTATASIQTRYVVGDLLDEAWPVAGDDFCEWIILRAVLHHIPGLKNRLGILKHAAGLLAPGGRLILANWQFLEIERLRRRLLPWAALGLSSEDIEAGDYLLDWQREGCGLRYVHWVDEAETQYLAQATGLHIEALFRADGHNNNLTLYAVLRFP